MKPKYIQFNNNVYRAEAFKIGDDINIFFHSNNKENYRSSFVKLISGFKGKLNYQKPTEFCLKVHDSLIDVNFIATNDNLLQLKIGAFDFNLIVSSDEIKESKYIVKAKAQGKVVDLKVKTGQSVIKGQPLYCIEAMKMETVIKSNQNGTIESISISNQQYLNIGDVVLEYKNDGSE